ncbi:MAG: hypothetical protein R6V85_13300 [Polyangia bacterium]
MSRNWIWAVLASLIASAACDTEDRSSGLDEGEIVVGAEQEEAMCENLSTEPSTGQVPKTAGTALGEGGAIDASSGRKTVELVEYEEQNGGYLRLSINPDDNTPVFMMLDADVPFAAVREDGTEVDEIDAGEPVCTEAAVRSLWIVSEFENHLRFGPTDLSSLHIVLETVQ